jgi:hypothetical protein
MARWGGLGIALLWAESLETVLWALVAWWRIFKSEVPAEENL